jgi:isopenicillin-N N-acyltransferase like protein
MKRWQRIVLAVPLAVAGVLTVLHFGVQALARVDPPDLPEVLGTLEQGPGELRRFGPSYARRIGKLWEVRLAGTVAEIGAAHANLLRDESIATEAVVWDLFSRFVPGRIARTLVLDLAQWHYREIPRSLSDTRLVELGAQARAFSPDPFDSEFPTFQRLIYLSALYDISLGFEHSPLIGCTTFTLKDENGRSLLARAFDFEVDPIFDEMKVVFLVREAGRIPYASVAWPGLVGVVSGMNIEGLGAVVHGARAGEVRFAGEPVVHALRRVLGTARTLDDAVAALGAETPMVSHMVILVDATGRSAVVERVPGQPPFVRELPPRAVVTNHLLGPYAEDPKNQRVRETTTTLARETRGRELVEAPGEVTPLRAVELLRDRKGPGGEELPRGDRRAIDALIATHGVIFSPSERLLWVSEAPHLLGRFVAFDLTKLLGPRFVPKPDESPRDALPMDHSGVAPSGHP